MPHHAESSSRARSEHKHVYQAGWHAWCAWCHREVPPSAGVCADEKCDEARHCGCGKPLWTEIEMDLKSCDACCCEECGGPGPCVTVAGESGGETYESIVCRACVRRMEG